MDDLDHRKAILQLLESAALSAAEVGSLLDRAVDKTYWQRLIPDLSIDENWPGGDIEVNPLLQSEVAKQVEKLRREGYFQTCPVLDPDLVARMRRGIERLRAERWPPVFSFVYDEFWQIVRTPSLRRLIAGYLGEQYRQNSLIWTYYVAPVRGAEGWPPHCDSSDNDSHLTVWVPLSDATVENGCMYVIPRDRMPKDLPSVYGELQSVTRAQLGRLLQAARALPSPPGAFLGWNHELIHWGSVSSGQTTPRISVAVEFIGPDLPPRTDEVPLFGPLQLPSFPERLRAIGKGLIEYGRFEPSATRYAELARRLNALPTL